MKKKTATATKTKKKTKKTTKKVAKKAAKKTPKNALSKPTLYVHATESGPQLCIKIPGEGADGVILPAEKQGELDSLYHQWTKQSAYPDFMKFPKATKWAKALIASCTFSEIEEKAPKKKKKK